MRDNDITVSIPEFFQPLTPGTYQVTVSSVGVLPAAPSMTVPAGSVISQDPSAGSDVEIGTLVTVLVSSGLPQVVVPDVVGLTQEAASSALTTASLTVGTITAQSSLTVPAGSVISQTPAAATDVVINTAVALVVSSGPAARGGPERRRPDPGRGAVR